MAPAFAVGELPTISGDIVVTPLPRTNRGNRTRRLLIAGMVTSLAFHAALLCGGIPGFQRGFSADGASTDVPVAMLPTVANSDGVAPVVTFEASMAERRRGSGLKELLEGAIAQRQLDGPQENLDELARMAERLDRVSSRKAVQAISGHLTSVLGDSPVDDFQTLPTARDLFDFRSAHLVRVEHSKDRQTYQAILEDRWGNAMSVELDQADGRRVQEVLALIEKHPLLKDVYDGIVRMLLDRMLDTGRTT